ncbi:DUF2889 domain-containing protein [Sphingobium sp. EM0848]|uniref:DUF2889 domain-containing protein n=1 Tax=Sphingobium sp. EM0848 TaxID=2743473 RepID=UPI00159C10BC|nr:DUF2889 domain-containing protein [Sphingobium sp. EM0848]
MNRQSGPPVPSAFPRNPAYGSGIYRRRIRLIRQERAVLSLIDDTNHAMWARIYHDSCHVTATEGQTIRAPNSNCPDASTALKELVGLPLAMPRAGLFGEGRPFRNCTHLFDAAALAMEEALRDEPGRIYDIIIPDESDLPIVAEVLLNGRPLLSWRLSKGAVIEFDPKAPIPIMKGFTSWATRHLQGEELDAAFLLQRAYLVSTARHWIVDQSPDLPITSMPELLGACYAYQPERVSEGVQAINTVIDLSAGFTDATLQPLPQ